LSQQEILEKNCNNISEKPILYTTTGSVVIPYVKGISEKFKWIGNCYNVKTIFKTKHTLKDTLMRTRPISDPQQHTASTAFHVNLTEVTMAKLADR
jgi:hypothetical protein